MRYKQNRLKQQLIYAKNQKRIEHFQPQLEHIDYSREEPIRKEAKSILAKPHTQNIREITKKYLPAITPQFQPSLFERMQIGMYENFNSCFIEKNDQIYRSYIAKDHTLEPGIYYRPVKPKNTKQNAVFSSLMQRKVFEPISQEPVKK